MKIISWISTAICSLLLIWTVAPHAHAQTWKPMCVSGGDKGGAHNNTWQRVNSSAPGGANWKRVGDCKCTNGATDYPVCTPQNPTPPPPPNPTYTHMMETGGWNVPTGVCGAGMIGYYYRDPLNPDPYITSSDGNFSPKTFNGVQIDSIYNSCGQAFVITTANTSNRNFFTSITIAGTTYYRRDAHVSDIVTSNGDEEIRYGGTNYAWSNPVNLKVYTKYEVIIR